MKRAAPDAKSFEPAVKRQKSLASFFVTSEKKQKQPAQELIVIEDDDLQIKSDRRTPPLVISSLTTPFPPPDHPSYRPPPSPTFNHPFQIPSIPDNLDLQYNSSSTSLVKPTLGLDLLYFKRFIKPSSSREFANYLLEALPWYRVKYTIRGLDINTPRFTTVFGKDLTDTPWTGYRCKPRAIPPILLRLMQKGKFSPFFKTSAETRVHSAEEVTDETYNFSLVNYYADGTDSISYHSDSESFLGTNPCIASLSLGAPRDFFLRHIRHKELSVPVEKFVLADGDMVVMRGSTQHDWQHSIPKRKSAEGRINITFRKGRAGSTSNYYNYNVGTGPMYRWKGGKMVQQG